MTYVDIDMGRNLRKVGPIKSAICRGGPMDGAVLLVPDNARGIVVSSPDDDDESHYTLVDGELVFEE